MERVEFRNSPEGVVYYKVDNHREKRLTKFSTELTEPLIKLIFSSYPECYARLSTIYKDDKFKMVERFIRCNFGENDLLTKDIENDMLNFEEVRCPLRGICPDEKVICKPKGTVNLSPCEKRVVDLYINGYTFDKIAFILGKNKSTVKSQLFSARDKLGVKNCREIIKVMRTKGY